MVQVELKLSTRVAVAVYSPLPPGKPPRSRPDQHGTFLLSIPRIAQACCVPENEHVDLQEGDGHLAVFLKCHRLYTRLVRNNKRGAMRGLESARSRQTTYIYAADMAGDLSALV
jgi:hypothetical protein